MRRWRSTLHEKGVCIKSLCKLFIFSRRGAIFIAEDLSGLGNELNVGQHFSNIRSHLNLPSS